MAGAAPEIAPLRKRVLVGSIIWATIMAASSAIVLYLWHWQSVEQLRLLSALYFAGGLMAWPTALYLLDRTRPHRSAETAFAAALIVFSLSTIGITLLLFILEFRLNHASFQPDELFQTKTLWSIATTIFQFAVIGMRLYLPFGLVALLAASWWYTRLPDQRTSHKSYVE